MDLMEKIIFGTLGIILITFVVFGVYDYHYAPSHSMMITPIVINSPSDGTSGIVMDSCLNTYKIYGGVGLGSYGSVDSDVNLMYCKDHNVTCNVTIVDHLFGNSGISKVVIPNSEKPEGCDQRV
jgi:hypothetical protein